MNTKAILAAAHKQHLNAVPSGSLKTKGGEYLFRYDSYACVYIVTDPDGTEGNRWNTRKISVAKKWQREWLEN